MFSLSFRLFWSATRSLCVVRSDQNVLNGHVPKPSRAAMDAKNLSLDDYIERQEQARAAQADLESRRLEG